MELAHVMLVEVEECTGRRRPIRRARTTQAGANISYDLIASL
jgi:hypothetical protein